MGTSDPSNEVQQKPAQNVESESESPNKSPFDQHGKPRNGKLINSNNGGGMKRSSSAAVFSDYSLLQSSSSGVVQRDPKVRKMQVTKTGTKQSSSSEHECPVCSKVSVDMGELHS